MNRSRKHFLLSLLSALVDGTLDEGQAGELVQLLKTDDESRRFYVRYLDMHAALTGRMPSASAARPRRFPWVAVVASLIAASVVWLWFVGVPGPQEDGKEIAEFGHLDQVVETLPSYVATVAAASSDAIVSGTVWRAGERLTPGRYAISAGTVTIEFDGGARILFEGESRFTLKSRRAVAIERATFVFLGDQTCESIEIVTPHSVFRNIGTRYAAIVGDLGEEVHVAEGAVRRTTPAGGDAGNELIEAGGGRRYRLDALQSESIPLDQSLASRPVDEGAFVSEGSTHRDRSVPLVWDDFRSDSPGVNGMASGIGWGGPWESRREGLTRVSPGLAGVGSVAMVYDGAGLPSGERKAAVHRRLAEPVDLSTDGIWYLRFLVRRGATAPKDEHQAMVVLRARGLTTQEEIDQNALIQIAIRKDHSALLRVADTLTRASLPLLPGQPYAVVAKIVAGRSKPDQVLVSLVAANRLAGSPEPNEWSLVSESVDSDLQLGKLSLELHSGGRVEFGGLCIGPTWASVAQPLDR